MLTTGRATPQNSGVRVTDPAPGRPRRGNLRLENGKVVERWGQSDQMGMMQQLGPGPA